jgi:P-type Ca2+ transporter type 2C
MQTQTEKLTGLSAAAAAQRLVSEGPNSLPSPDRRNLWRILFDVVREPMFVLLMLGGGVYLALGDLREAVFLLFFGAFSVFITVVQESRSERVLETLRELSSPHAQVIRDGKKVQLASREVVREDLMLVSEGNRIVADASLISCNDLLVDESLLTGESVPVSKVVSVELPGDAMQARTDKSGSDSSAHLYAGTLVVRGSGMAVVLATGVKAEIGKIGLALKKIEPEESPLKTQIRRLVRIFATLGGSVGILTIFLYGALRGSWLEALLAGLAIGMSMLPEEFPLVLAVFMAMGAWRISQAKVLTRRASAIEALGATTLLCTDKTGTLTENKMALICIVGASSRWDRTTNPALSEEVKRALRVARWACAGELSDPMDIAIEEFCKQETRSTQGPVSERRPVRTYGLRPDLSAFTSITTSLDGLSYEAYSKGAIEAIAQLCRLSPEQLAKLRRETDVLAASGLRVLGLAQAIDLELVDANSLPESPLNLAFQFVGLIGFADPLRANVPAAIKECREAGIRVVMITGDYPITAQAIARQAGIDSARVITGDEIDQMSDRELTSAVISVSIFARIRPQQKLRLVESFKASREIVAMTGDGVNDAPAIKAAHIGIAMGSRGSEVAREASAIVLLNDDFGAIVKAIRLGRRIYDNLRKSVEYIIAVHIPIAGLTLFPLAFGLPLILTPIHIAFLEMVVDPACSVVFEAEREEPNVMNRPPRNASGALLPERRVVWACLQGLLSLGVLVALLLSAVFAGATESDVRALVFTSLILVNLSLILVNRSYSASISRTISLQNRSFWILLISVCCLLVPLLLWSPTKTMFRLGDVHALDLLICLLAAIVNLVILQWIKSRWFIAPENDGVEVGGQVDQ